MTAKAKKPQEKKDQGQEPKKADAAKKPKGVQTEIAEPAKPKKAKSFEVTVSGVRFEGLAVKAGDRCSMRVKAGFGLGKREFHDAVRLRPQQYGVRIDAYAEQRSEWSEKTEKIEELPAVEPHEVFETQEAVVGGIRIAAGVGKSGRSVSFDLDLPAKFLEAMEEIGPGELLRVTVFTPQLELGV